MQVMAKSTATLACVATTAILLSGCGDVSEFTTVSELRSGIRESAVARPEAAHSAALRHRGDLNCNPNNCGQWGNSCLGGDCIEGKCQPVTLASGENYPCGVGVDDEYVYWASIEGNFNDWSTVGGTVKRVPIGGGLVTTLATNQPGACNLVLDGDFLYWGGWFPETSRVMKMHKSGGEPEELAANQDFVAGLVVEDGMVYWSTESENGTISRVSVEGGPTEIIATGQSYPYGVDVQGGSVYWTTKPYRIDQSVALPPDEPQIGSVMKASINGGTPVPLAVGQDGPRTVAVHRRNVYWTNAREGTINRTSIFGGPRTVLASGESQAYYIIADGRDLYFDTYLTDGYVARLPRGGGEPEILAGMQNFPEAIVTDRKAVYWATGLGGTVMKIAKPRRQGRGRR